MIQCDYWFKNNIHGGGGCSLGLFGGNPSFGICNKCLQSDIKYKTTPQLEPTEEQKKGISENQLKRILSVANNLDIKTELPPFREQVKNAVIASRKVIKNAIKNKPILVDDEIREGREEICEKCDNLKNGRCFECGCFLAMKLVLATEKCPIGKWS